MIFLGTLYMHITLGRLILQIRKNQILSTWIGIRLQGCIYHIVRQGFIRANNVKWTLLLQCFRVSLPYSKEQRLLQAGRLGPPGFNTRIPFPAQILLLRILFPIVITTIMYTTIMPHGLPVVLVHEEGFSQPLGLCQDPAMAIIFMRKCSALSYIPSCRSLV